MNRKLALVLTVVIFAAIAFCFLRPMDRYDFVTYGEFGNIKSVYLEGDVEIPIKVSGETDLLTVTKFIFDYQGDMQICLKAAEGRKFTMGTKPANYATDAWDGDSFEIATLEIYKNGKWVYDYTYGRFNYVLFCIHYDIYPTIVTDVEYPYPLRLPYSEPGKYRLTFNFCEYFGEDKSHYCESDETIHHITMEYEVPRASDSRYDVLYVHTPCQSERVRLAIRANDGAAPFRRYDKVEVEQLVNGKWIARDIVFFNATPNYYEREYYDDNPYSDYRITLNSPFDSGSDYRITFYFTEQKRVDGKYSEDYMPLQIHIRTLSALDRIFDCSRYDAPIYRVLNMGLQFIAK